ncbi:MAG TPA: 2-succinyl-5-enolpyruvyl-6-hydroxy-3-cyclohexene-1-carboxylic-acid synthase, partial [Gemmatimonadaceae bacterium]|nr:2-succinyl-5-enolpyruvyl-6-hydroxy-3-cyclohexene-1-carboxylic-acid synthase [Gemmatimonadaceae bacterium]
MSAPDASVLDPTLDPARVLGAYVAAVADELARSGVRHACVAPGSRSTPLALALLRHPDIRVWMHLDERSAGYFALGMAKTMGEPVALLCTSGTAAANFLPAVVEARYARVPLVVLTANRPPELQEVGAPQTVDQRRLYGSHAKWFAEAALPEASPALLRYARALACRAVGTARQAPAGPVHLDFPFREPLVPVFGDAPAGWSTTDRQAWAGRDGGRPWTTVRVGPVAPADEAVRELTALLLAAERPVIVCGPHADAQLASPLAWLAGQLGAPLLADPLSQLRFGPHDGAAVIATYDALLRDARAAATLEPDLVLRFGAAPTSKAAQLWLERHACARQVVVDAGGWPDPAHVAGDVVHADPGMMARAIVARLGDGEQVPDCRAWLGRWRRADEAVRRAMDGALDAGPWPFEGRAMADLAALLPDGATLWVSSSMPVRDLDAFAAASERRVRVLANRGANGIDGVVSSALGAAAAAREAGGGPVALAIGDLAFYHDMNGLLAARLHALDATV